MPLTFIVCFSTIQNGGVYPIAVPWCWSHYAQLPLQDYHWPCTNWRYKAKDRMWVLSLFLYCMHHLSFLYINYSWVQRSLAAGLCPEGRFVSNEEDTYLQADLLPAPTDTRLSTCKFPQCKEGHSDPSTWWVVPIIILTLELLNSLSIGIKLRVCSSQKFIIRSCNHPSMLLWWTLHPRESRWSSIWPREEWTSMSKTRSEFITELHDHGSLLTDNAMTTYSYGNCPFTRK